MTPQRFLFLQGPHGPFFAQLGAALRSAGHEVWRVGFTGGDRLFWPGSGYLAFRDQVLGWPAFLDRVLTEHGITDLVLYGDQRLVHTHAMARAADLGLRLHVFEEGYLRPHWVTYERGPVNTGSKLVQIPSAAMGKVAARLSETPRVPPPDRWGDMRQHMAYSAIYHACVALGPGYPGYRSHRGISVWTEARLHLARLLSMPVARLSRRVATARVTARGQPFHLVLLQLAHDAQFRAANPMDSQTALIDRIAQGFATAAPRHHQLVFKAHPLEDGRENLRRAIRAAARRHGIAGRVHFLNGGKLAPLLDEASSALTVNSTAGHQVLWRGLPLCALGPALYRRPGLASDQSVAEFFADPMAPDPELYAAFRLAMLTTSQVPGSFYSARGRRRLLRRIVDRMLAPVDAYDLIWRTPESPGPQIVQFDQRRLAKSPHFR